MPSSPRIEQDSRFGRHGAAEASDAVRSEPALGGCHARGHCRRRRRRADAGLDAACARHRLRRLRGLAAIRELGVGINVLPHAIAELAELGLLPRLDEVAIRTRELIYANRFGQEIWREPRGVDAGYKVPQFSIHRGRLQGVLREAVLERLAARRCTRAMCSPCSRRRKAHQGALQKCPRARAPRWPATSWSAATASIRRFAGSSIPTRPGSSGTAS